MSGVETTYLVVGIICVLLSAFFASAEIAFINLEHLRIRHLQESGRRGADRVARIMERPERFLSVVLTSISFTETIAVALGGFLFLSLLEEPTNKTFATVFGIVVMALVLLLFVKVIPKTIAAQHPEGMALRYAPAIDLTSKAVSPIVNVLGWITDRLAFPGHAHFVKGTLMSKAELRTCILISHERGVVDGTSAEMLKRVVKFGDLSVREIMVPRNKAAWIKEGTTLAGFNRVYGVTPHVRYPVYEDDYDNVKGMLSARDVHMAMAQGSIDHSSVVTGFTRPVYFVPGTKLVGELFSEMRDRGLLMAVVVSEHGGTSGVVTMRQLVEEIVGEVGEELVAARSEFEAISEHAYQIDGTMRIEDANEQLDLGIPETEYDTLGGFVLHLMGHLPKEGDQVLYGNLRLAVLEVRENRIARVMATKEEEETEEVPVEELAEDDGTWAKEL